MTREPRLLRQVSCWLAVGLFAGGCATTPVATTGKQAEETWDGPDLLVAGRVHTFDPQNPTAEAVLVRGSRILCVGALGTCSELAKPDVVRMSLGAGSVMPGIVDAHVDVLLLGRALRTVRCEDAASEDECAARVAARAAVTPKGDWIHGVGWDERRWPGRELPRERSLSLAVPDHPVILERVDGNAVWVNERALALANVHEFTPDPLGGKIARYGDGRPSGVLTYDAQELMRRVVASPSTAENELAILDGIGEFARVGITEIHAMDATPAVLAAYEKAAAADRLPLRVYAIIDGAIPREQLEGIVARFRGAPTVGKLTVRAVSLRLDGPIETREAALLAPYADAPGQRGALAVDRDAIRRFIEEVAGWGMQPVLHAFGDRAVEEAVSALEEVNARLVRERDEARAAAEAAEAASAPKKKKKKNDEQQPDEAPSAVVEEPAPVKAWRVRLEDVELFEPERGAVMRDLGVVVSQQPLDALAAPEVVEERLGRERVLYAFPWREMSRWPIPLAFGSGFPDRRHDPRYGIVAAEERRPEDASRPWTPDQRLDRLNALRAYTVGAAHAAFVEGRRGMIRKGFDADLTVFSDDVMAVPANRVADLRPLATVVGGAIAWESERLLRTGRKPAAGAKPHN